MRLNQFIAHAGICSRRKAEQLILTKKIKVNGEYICDLAYQVLPNDKVSYAKKVLSIQPKSYFLFNKPLNTITTVKDPQGRRTVVDLMPAIAKKERIYPVGRLDRNTTGLLLFTNDGPLAHRLAHPSYKIKKVYEVTLKEKVTSKDIALLKKGLRLPDGITQVDAITVLDPAYRKLHLTLHSGKNRIVRRLFEALGHQLTHLERIGYAHLSLKDLAVGAWRTLTPQEITLLLTSTNCSVQQRKKNAKIPSDLLPALK